jgi:hypothetical protein
MYSLQQRRRIWFRKVCMWEMRAMSWMRQLKYWHRTSSSGLFWGEEDRAEALSWKEGGRKRHVKISRLTSLLCLVQV